MATITGTSEMPTIIINTKQYIYENSKCQCSPHPQYGHVCSSTECTGIYDEPNYARKCCCLSLMGDMGTYYKTVALVHLKEDNITIMQQWSRSGLHPSWSHCLPPDNGEGAVQALEAI